MSAHGILSLYQDAARFDAIAGQIDDDILWWQETFGDGIYDILELGCGTGRVALALAGNGHRVVGLDNAPVMLAAAQAKDQNQLCQWREGEFRNIESYPANSFDAVIFANNTISHVHSEAELTALCAGAWQCLRPGGRLIIDTFAPNDDLRSAGGEELLTYPDAQSGEEVSLFEEHCFDPETALLHVLWHHRPVNGAASALPEAMALRLWNAADFIDLAGEIGFTKITLAGDYDGSGFTQDSPLILFTATK